MSNDVHIQLSNDEALVLFEMVSRLDSDQGVRFEHQAEHRVLWSIEAQLQPLLREPLLPNYRSLLAAARDRVASSK